MELNAMELDAMKLNAMKLNERMMHKMIQFDEGDPKRIQHFTKVYAYAHQIGVEEGLDAMTQKVLDVAAILHDIGIIPTEKKLGYCTGKLQEEEGPAYAKELLADEEELSDEQKERICYLIAHHHTYTDVDGLDYRILLEADFLVNALEDDLPKENVAHGRDSFFETISGIRMINWMFGLSD